MQLGRSYSRRLKKMKHEINELYPSARHAYRHIDLAVKTSRPHMIRYTYVLPQKGNKNTIFHEWYSKRFAKLNFSYFGSVLRRVLHITEIEPALIPLRQCPLPVLT